MESYQIQKHTDPHDAPHYWCLIGSEQVKLDALWDLLPGESARRYEEMDQHSRQEAFRAGAAVLAAERDAKAPRLRVVRDSAARKPDLFHRWTMPELLAQPDTFSWLVRGLLASPTYGQIAGEMKSLKSYVAMFMAVGVASGAPILGHFHVPEPRPVVAYVGEGGRLPWTRRLRRICEAMGVDPSALDLHPRFDVAPIADGRFQDTLATDLTGLRPGLVLLDPFYAFHGADTDARNLHQEGALLSSLSGACMNAEASLMVVNHMNQTGTGSGLKRITMAGSGEWVDSWMLLAVREANVDAGAFRLAMEVGSRQWGGTTYDVDLNVGRFDAELCMHDGPISWDVRRAEFGAERGGDSDKLLSTKKAILDVIADHPWELTKTAIKRDVGGDRERFTTAFGDLATENKIKRDALSRMESGTTKTRPLWGPGTAWPYEPIESEPDSG